MPHNSIERAITDMNNISESIAVCPVCRTEAGEYFIKSGIYRIYKCASCGLEHTYPLPSIHELKEFYDGYTDIRAASDVVTMNTKRNLQLLSGYGYNESKYILDFGTGDADFVRIAGDKCFGIDFKPSPEPRVYETLNELPIKEYDFITLWGVLEHLSDPMSTIAELGAYKKSGTIISITTVDSEGLIPYYYKPVEHLTYWTRHSFKILFKRNGIELLEYNPYKMMQKSEVYADRILSRTPSEYKQAFNAAAKLLPEYVEIPTNEVFVVGRYF
jgi:Methyltransferase domain